MYHIYYLQGSVVLPIVAAVRMADVVAVSLLSFEVS